MESSKRLMLKIFDHFFGKLEKIHWFRIFKREDITEFGLNVYIKCPFEELDYLDMEFCLNFEDTLATFTYSAEDSRMFHNFATVPKSKIDTIKEAVIKTCIETGKSLNIVASTCYDIFKMQIIPATKSLEELAIKMDLEK